MFKISRFLLILILITGWIFSGWPQIWQNPSIPPEVQEAEAAVSYVDAGVLGAALTTTDATAALPASTQTNDILIIHAWTRSTADTTTITEFTEFAQVDTTLGSHRWFWKRHDGSEGTATCDHNQSADNYCQMFAFRGVVTSGNPWNALGTPENDPDDAGTAGIYTLTGITTGAANSMVVVFTGYEDNDETSVAMTGTDPSAYTEVYTESGTGADGSISMGYALRTDVGATGDITVDYASVATSDAAGSLVLSLAPLVVAPTVTTSATVDSITQTSATLNGNITATGGENAAEHGFAYGTAASLSPAIATTTGGVFSGTGAFTSAGARNISGLTCNTVYYYRAYATNSGGTGYGTPILNFTTSACKPTVTTNEETDVTSSTATLNGEITVTGGENATQHGFASSTDPTLTTGVSTSTLGSFVGTGTFNENLTGLAPETPYYFRAYATNSGGTGYGSILSFTTAVAPSLTLIVDTDNFPPLTPGTPVFATSTVSVDTNNTNGWYVTLARDDLDTTMDLDTDATVNIIDQTAWVPGAATTTAGNAVKISSFINSADVLAFRVMTASSTNGSMFLAPSWWGSADNYIDNASTLWAGVNSTAQKIGISSVSSGGSPALNTVLYYLDVPNTQKTGAYSGNVIFTAVMN